MDVNYPWLLHRGLGLKNLHLNDLPRKRSSKKEYDSFSAAACCQCEGEEDGDNPPRRSRPLSLQRCEREEDRDNFPRRSRPLSLQRHVANARGRKIETILQEGVDLFLCSDARERKIEMLDQGWGFGCCGGDVVPSHWWARLWITWQITTSIVT